MINIRKLESELWESADLLRQGSKLKQFDSEVENALMDYINYYNNDRIKLRLKGKSPVQYRTLYHDN